MFHQFLDAVFQLLNQHTTRFEFNERFLRRLFYHLYSCQYGTFLLNNEKQRKDAKLHEKTTSVWDYFLSRQDQFINPDYDPTINDHVRGQERLIFPVLEDIRWWYTLFGRTDKEMNSSLDADAARKDRVAETVESLSASPRLNSPRRSTSPPGGGIIRSPPLATGLIDASPLNSGTTTPQARTGHQLTFGNTVLAGIEIPTGGPLASLTKGLSGLGLGGIGDSSKSSGYTGNAAREQEMSSMSETGNVAP